MTKDEFWKKVPRSSRLCITCGHRYASHISERCLKIISRNPRKECDCKKFWSEKDEEIERRRKALSN